MKFHCFVSLTDIIIDVVCTISITCIICDEQYKICCAIKNLVSIHDVHRDKENSEKSKSCSNRSFSLLVYYWKFYVKS